MAGITRTGDGRQVRRLVLRFVLSRGPVGEIERDACYQSDDQGRDKSGGKAQWSDVAVVQEGQQNGEDQGQSEAQHMTLEIDRFAWLTLHVRRALSGTPPRALTFPVFGRVPCWSTCGCRARHFCFLNLSRGSRQLSFTARIFSPAHPGRAKTRP